MPAAKESTAMSRALCLLVLMLMLVLGPAGARAAHESGEAYPEQVSATNPYGESLKAAKQAYADAYQRYREAYARATWSWAYYQAYYSAYYALYSAYYTYRWYLQLYWWYEHSTRFAGRVVVDDLIDYFPRPPAPPVAGATVQLTTYVPPGSYRPIQLLGTRTTDADGRFRFDGVTAGTYAYSVTKAGFSMVSGTVEVRAGAGELTIRLRRTRGVSGVVLTRPLYGNVPVDPPPGYLDPRPLPGARVTLYRTDVVYIVAPGPDRTATTDANGRFEFPDVNFSSARVVVEKSSYRTASQNVVLTTGSATVRIVLEYTGPLPPIARPSEPGHDDLNRQ
jgi:hypothetical protein